MASPEDAGEASFHLKKGKGRSDPFERATLVGRIKSEEAAVKLITADQQREEAAKERTHRKEMWILVAWFLLGVLFIAGLAMLVLGPQATEYVKHCIVPVLTMVGGIALGNWKGNQS